MGVQRMDNVAIVVEDLDATIAFFVELGLVLEDRQQIEGEFAEQAVGIPGLRSEIAMMTVPGGGGRLELTRYVEPDPVPTDPPLPNTIGLHRVMFAVDDIHDTVERLGAHGGEVLDRIANYADVYLLCYLRGPSGIIVGLAEQIG